MQNDINEYELDKKLSISDSYGKSAIFCSYQTAQKILEICNAPLNKYKGHDIYINNSIVGYRVFPINFDRFIKLEDYNAE